MAHFQVFAFFQPPGKAKEDEKEENSEEKPKQKKSRRSDMKVGFNLKLY